MSDTLDADLSFLTFLSFFSFFSFFSFLSFLTVRREVESSLDSSRSSMISPAIVEEEGEGRQANGQNDQGESNARRDEGASGVSQMRESTLDQDGDE